MDNAVTALVLEDEVDRRLDELKAAQESGAEVVRRYVVANAHRFYVSGTIGLGNGRMDDFMRGKEFLTVGHVLAMLSGEAAWTLHGRFTATCMKKGYEDPRPLLAKLKFLAERWADTPWAVFVGDSVTSATASGEK